jgi:hypothetical protein
MPTPRVPFEGYPPYLAAAAAAPGLAPGAADFARRQPALGQVASLVSQAAYAESPHPDTLAKLRELRDGLRVAADAAAQMVALVETDEAPARRRGRRAQDEARHHTEV